MTNADRSTNHAADQSPAAALWRIVASEYEQASAQFDRHWAAFEEAEAAAQAEYPPRLRELQDTFGLRVHMTLGEATDVMDRFIAGRDKATERDFADNEVDAQAAEAERVAGEFFALVRGYRQIQDTHRVNELHRVHQSFVAEVYDPARERLLATPAPDLSALFHKARVLAGMFEEAEGLEADLRRLLAEGK